MPPAIRFGQHARRAAAPPGMTDAGPVARRGPEVPPGAVTAGPARGMGSICAQR